jgi:hypothetical protein
MRLFTCKSIYALATFGLLSTMAALVWFSDPGIIIAQSSAPFIVEGKVIVNGRAAPDGSYIIAYIDGRDVAEAQTKGGIFVMAIPEQPGQHLTGMAVEFAGKGSGGTLFDFAQKTVWSPGGRANLRLELNTDSGFGGSQPTTFSLPFVVEGKVVIDGNIAPDGTLIAAYIFGSRIYEEAHVRGGKFELKISQQTDSPPFDSQVIEFQALFPDGRFRDFPQTVHWQAGGFAQIGLDIGQFREPFKPQIQPREPTSPFGISIPQIPQLPDGIDIGCVIGVLGRLPSSLQDMSPEENLRVTRECFSGSGFQPDDSARRELEQLQFQQEKLRLEQELAFQQEQQRLETQRLKQDQAFQEEQQSLDRERRTREQERIKREQALQEEQDRLDRDRLKSERERQQEQSRLDQERLRQEQDRFQAEQEMQADQQRLDQRRALDEQERQDELEKARFESERARIERDRSLEEERARLDQERLRRDDERLRQESAFNQNRQGQGPGGSSPEAGGSGDAQANTGPTRGFFTNSQIGQLGSLNNFLEPATLAVIGILITLVASTLQLVKGN